MTKPGDIPMRCGRLFLFTLIALAALAWSAPARDEAPHAAPDAAHPHPGEKPAEPPIFTPVRIDLGIWTLVVFLLLFFILAKYAWGPMLEGLKRREETIRGALDDAQRARDEAQRVHAELE